MVLELPFSFFYALFCWALGKVHALLGALLRREGRVPRPLARRRSSAERRLVRKDRQLPAAPATPHQDIDRRWPRSAEQRQLTTATVRSGPRLQRLRAQTVQRGKRTRRGPRAFLSCTGLARRLPVIDWTMRPPRACHVVYPPSGRPRWPLAPAAQRTCRTRDVVGRLTTCASEHLSRGAAALLMSPRRPTPYRARVPVPLLLPVC